METWVKWGIQFLAATPALHGDPGPLHLALSLLFLCTPARMVVHQHLTFPLLISWKGKSTGREVLVAAPTQTAQHSRTTRHGGATTRASQPCPCSRWHTQKGLLPLPQCSSGEVGIRQMRATFCAPNSMKEVIGIHNLNLMCNSGKWD